MAINLQTHSSLPPGITPYEIIFSRLIHRITRAPHTDRLELLRTDDAEINRFFTLEAPVPDSAPPIVIEKALELDLATRIV